MIWLNKKELHFSQFPNGESNVYAEDFKHLVKSSNTIHFKYESDQDLIHLMFVKKHLDTFVVDYTNLIIFYMPYSRMDRSEKGSVFTLKYVAEFINELGFCKVTTIEPHSDVTPAVFKNARSYMINEDLLPKVMDEVGFDKDDDYLVYPDAGAQKRYAKMFDGHTLVAHKDRDFATGRIKSLELMGDKDANLTGRTAIIVDDLSSYGGTFLLTAAQLKARGFSKVYLLVAHAETSIFKGNLFDADSPIDKIFTTDSIISTEHNLQQPEKLHVYSVMEHLL